MSPVAAYLSNFKEFVLILTILYFYGLAFAMTFGKSLYGLDRPAIFLLMCTLFLIAIGYEIFFTWWKSNIMIIWALIWILSYGVIGLYLAPIVFGDWIISYILIEPLIIVFMGGFAFSFGSVLAGHLTARPTLSPGEISSALEKLPGWHVEKHVLSKTYEFADFSQAMNFVNQVGRLAENMRHYPDIKLSGGMVSVSVFTRDGRGLTKNDIAQARDLDAI